MTRIFKIGAQQIVEDEHLHDLSVEAVQAILQRTYPEIAQSTVRTHERGTMTVVEFVPRPGRKG